MLRKYLVYLCLLVAVAAVANSCVYYNTFYLARKNFNQAEDSRKKANRDKASGAEITQYQAAIKKSSKVLSEHPNSGWVDDALFVIGKSFYYLGDFAKSERKFRELLSNFPDSKFADESRFYLGKSRYQLDNYVMAQEIFEEYLKTSKNREWKAEALYLMAEMAAAQELQDKAIKHYTEFVNTYRSDFRAREVYDKIGQLQFDSKDYSAAVESYGQSAKLAIEPMDRYQALYKQGRALYEIDSIETGLALFEDLREEQRDSVNLGNLLLRIAEGKNRLGQERDAILLYDDVATSFRNRVESAEAYYRLGEIAQDAWGDLRVAKGMYEEASKEQRGGDWRTKASEKVSNIKKVETYLEAVSSDSAKDVVESRYLLAEIYRIDLNRPDSALHEYQTIVENYPESDFAPKSLLAIGWLQESHYNDTTLAHTYYQKVIDNYPKSDAVQEAIDLLQLQGAEPYEHFPDRLYSQAENQFVDENNLDSARVLFSKLIEDFPKSRLTPKAEFALAMIRLKEFVPSTKPVNRPKPKIVKQDSLDIELPDTLQLNDSLMQPVKLDSLQSLPLDSTLKPTNIAASPVSTPVASTELTGVGSLKPESTKVVPKDSVPVAKQDTTKAPESAAPGDTVIRLSDMIGNKARAADSLQQAASKDSLNPAPAGAPSNDSLVRLSQMLTDKRDAKSDSLAQSMGAKADSVKVKIANEDKPIFQTDSNGVIRPVRDSAEVKAAPKDTVYIDSTMIWVFQELAEKYAGTTVGDEAARLAQGGAGTNRRNDRQGLQEQQHVSAAPSDSMVRQDTSAVVTDTLSEAEQRERYLREEIDKWPLMDDPPSVVGPFVYPVEASTSKFEGRVVVKIKIEFDGKVSEVIFLKPSNIKPLDDQIEKALLETYFDPLKIDALKIGNYFIYNYEVVLPEVYR